MSDKLRLLRERRSLSQTDLAHAVGISRQALSSIETGKQDPSLKTAMLLAQALDTNLDFLFGAGNELETSANIKTLTKPERLSFANQYEILKRLSPDKKEIEHFDRLINIFRYGYESLYHEAFDLILSELPEEIAEETLAILDLHQTLLWSLGEDPTPQELERVKFRGFDGNNEAKYLAFARFYASDGNAYRDLNIANSHHTTLNRYNRMLAAWDEMGRPFDLTKAQADEILDAGTYKSQQR